jgi:hypothetical protein
LTRYVMNKYQVFNILQLMNIDQTDIINFKNNSKSLEP